MTRKNSMNGKYDINDTTAAAGAAAIENTDSNKGIKTMRSNNSTSFTKRFTHMLAAGSAALLSLTGAAGAQTSAATNFVFFQGLQNANGWSVDKHPRMLADVNGDGKDDIVGFSSGGVVVALSYGNGFAWQGKWSDAFGYGDGWQVGRHSRTLGDVDGDGLMDIVGFGEDGIWIAHSTGSGFSAPARAGGGFGANTGWTEDKYPRTVGDVDGDGKADVVAFGYNGVRVQPSNGSSFVAGSLWSDSFGYKDGWRVDLHRRMVADVNGDDRDDIVGIGDSAVYVALSTGTSFSSLQTWSNDFTLVDGWYGDEHPRLMADINADGLADLVGFATNKVVVALSTGTGFDAPQTLITNFDPSDGWSVATDVRTLADVDGDGDAEIVAFGDTGAETHTAELPAIELCMGRVVTISGTEGNDYIIGTDGSDVIASYGGDDYIAGLGGDDYICTGTGYDWVFGGAGFNVVFDPTSINGAQLHDALLVTDAYCNGHRVTIWGTEGDDYLVGTSGADVINGLRGNDYILGKGGNDVICGDEGDDMIGGGEGDDIMLGGNGDDRFDLDEDAVFHTAGPSHSWSGEWWTGTTFLGTDQIFGGEGYDSAMFYIPAFTTFDDSTETDTWTSVEDIVRGAEYPL